MTRQVASRPNMPGYGILDADEGEGLFPWSWAVECLSSAHTYWVATTRKNGAPHVMPVWGVVLDDMFCFSTGSQSRKARNLSENPKCVITCEVNQDQIIVEGEAAVTTESKLKGRFAAAYAPKYDFNMEGFDEPVYVVRPKVVFGFTTSEDAFTSTATRWTFYE
jgi:hypothetical protein